MSLGAVFVLLLSVVVSAALLLAVLGLIWFFDRYDREPLHLVAAVFLWGAAAAPTMSMLAFGAMDAVFLELQTRLPDLVVGSLATPLVEEMAKGLGIVLLVLFSRHFDNPTDGLVYGTAVGLGFAITENFIYAVGAGTVPPFETSGMLMLTGGRTLFSAGVHAVSSSVFGGFLGYALLNGRWGLRLFLLVIGYLAAVLLHGAWNLALMLFGPFSADGTLQSWLVVVPMVYVVFAVVLAAFLRSEHSILKRQLEDEVRLATAPPWVAEIIPYYRRRVRSDWWPDRRERTVISRLLTRVAFRKHALRHLPVGKASLASLEVVKLRQRVREILRPELGDKERSDFEAF